MNETYEARWRIDASFDRAIVGLCNGLSSILHQAIILNNDDLLLIWTLGTNFIEFIDLN